MNDEIRDEILSTKRAIEEAKLQKEQAVAQIKQMQAKSMAGRLVDARKVSKDAFNEGRRLRDAILAIPSRLAPELASEVEPDLIESILMKALRDCLEGLTE